MLIESLVFVVNVVEQKFLLALFDLRNVLKTLTHSEFSYPVKSNLSSPIQRGNYFGLSEYLPEFFHRLPSVVSLKI